MNVLLKIALTITMLFIVISANAQSSSPAGNAPVAVGVIAPEFTLVDQNGNKVALNNARKDGPVVLVFYRGYW